MPAPAPLVVPDGVSVALQQYRTDYGPRRLEIEVTNGSSAPITVRGVAFTSAYFSGEMTDDGDEPIPPGSTRDFRVDLGAPSCDAGEPEPSAVVTIVAPDGRTASRELVPTDPLGWLERVHADDCLEAGVAAVTVTVGPLSVDRSGERPVAVLRIAATRAGSGAATIADVRRTILLRPEDDAAAWPLDWTLDADRAGASAELRIVPSNCNPHILAEDKRGTYWPLDVTLADGAGGTVYVYSGDEIRDGLYAFFAEYCGF